LGRGVFNEIQGRGDNTAGYGTKEFSQVKIFIVFNHVENHNQIFVVYEK
jgi:hypothetical protein